MRGITTPAVGYDVLEDGSKLLCLSVPSPVVCNTKVLNPGIADLAQHLLAFIILEC